jgi:hypothetical protein
MGTSAHDATSNLKDGTSMSVTPWPNQSLNATVSDILWRVTINEATGSPLADIDVNATRRMLYGESPHPI